jgi:cobalt-zinc-cadmium efflux system protein
MPLARFPSLGSGKSASGSGRLCESICEMGSGHDTGAAHAHRAGGRVHGRGLAHDRDSDAHAAGHVHRPGPDSDPQRLKVALALIVCFMVAEVSVGVVASSLALLSDAGHMLTDAVGIGLALAAASLARRPAKGRMTYGLARVEILSAQFNGATLLVLALLIVYAAVRHLVHPPATEGVPMLAVALVGVLVNLAATWQLSRADRSSMNVEGTFQHVLTDLFGFIGTAIGAAVILATGFDRADAIASLLVAALMLQSSYGLLRESALVFLEASPRELDPEAIGRAMAAVEGVAEVHDLHVWEVSSGFPALSAHVLVGRDRDCHATRRELEAVLGERFELEHTTLQVDHAGEDLLELELSPKLRRG